MGPGALLGVQMAGDVAGSLAEGWFNRESARDQMAFQERMASTQYQRAAKDMAAAGLNPVIALGQPAAAPSGSAASISAPKLGSNAVQAASAASAISLQKKQELLLDSQIGKTNAETANIEADTLNKPITGEQQRANINLMGEQMKEIGARIEEVGSRIGLNSATVHKLQKELAYITAQTRLTNANASEAEFKKVLFDKLLPYVKSIIEAYMPSAKNNMTPLEGSRLFVTDLLEDMGNAAGSWSERNVVPFFRFWHQGNSARDDITRNWRR